MARNEASEKKGHKKEAEVEGHKGHKKGPAERKGHRKEAEVEGHKGHKKAAPTRKGDQPEIRS